MIGYNFSGSLRICLIVNPEIHSKNVGLYRDTSMLIGDSCLKNCFWNWWTCFCNWRQQKWASWVNYFWIGQHHLSLFIIWTDLAATLFVRLIAWWKSWNFIVIQVKFIKCIHLNYNPFMIFEMLWDKYWCQNFHFELDN